MPPRVAFQGETGAFSEAAVLRHFGEAVCLPRPSFAAVFAAVVAGEAEYGVVPIENSQAGSINQTYDLLLAHETTIVGEVTQRIRHCLLGLPGQKLADIATVHSHPQALEQSREFLERLGVEVVPAYDTAGSAKLIREQGLRGVAAVASRRAAEIYGLAVLADGIETNPNNYTKFFIIQLADAAATGERAAPHGWKTSLVFVVKHTPGTLYHALGAMATRGINLAKLESRPLKQTPWEYVFYADFEAHADDPRCHEALDDLRERCIFLKILGSYPKAPPEALADLPGRGADAGGAR